ncbi:hypothetical protein [Actinomadura sp. WMMA1423]|uniref:hypothetical protein n=1 Tax=Actinomadura sp. WMMA1423 TaxID=2591108 RepID=UPI00114625D4|nr:hypothetical protein [Actinomadura sp. WMMA1423]
MGLDNPPGGPGKDPETTDKPTPPDTGGRSSGDHPGADGKTPRADSLRAAGWKIPEQPDTGNGHREDRDDRQGQSNESSPADPSGEKPKAPADQSTETDPKDKEKLGAGDTEDTSQSPEEDGPDKTDPAKNGASGPETEKSGQARPENPRQDQDERKDDDRESGTSQPETGETRGKDEPGKEPSSQDSGSATDDPAPSEQQSFPLAEASQYPPGSRLESLARAREEQHAYAEEQRDKSQDANGPQPPGEQGDNSAPPHTETVGEQERGPEAQPPATEAPLAETDGADRDSGDPHAAGDQSPPSDEGADPLAPEPLPTQGPEHEPNLSQDSEKLSDASNQQPDPTTDSTPPTEGQVPEENEPTPGPETHPPADPAIEPHAEQIEDGGREPSEPVEGKISEEPKTEESITEPLGDGDLGPRVHEGRPADATQPPLPESAEQPPENQVEGPNTEQTEPPGDEDQAAKSPDEHDGDHGRNAEEPSTGELERNTLPYMGMYNPDGHFTQTLDQARRNNSESPQPHETDLPSWLANPIEIQQSPTQDDFDPVAANREPGVVAKAPDRRKKSETDPESRTERFRGATWRRGNDLKDAATLSRDAGKGILGPPPAPTGHSEINSAPSISPQHTQVATTDSVMGVVTGAMVAFEGTRKLLKKIF